MDKRSNVDFTKQDNQTNDNSLKVNNDVRSLEKMHEEINMICAKLSVSSTSFNKSETYTLIGNYIKKYKRWLYSDVSTYLFGCDEKSLSAYISNLDQIYEYAFLQLSQCSTEESIEHEDCQQNALAIEKLWDHSNLAQTQNQQLHDSDDTFAARFKNNLIPFKAEFSKEMNMQFISLIAIFTALSFIVFGGISSLDNILEGAGNVPILDLILVACVWSLGIVNLVFVFIFMVAKLTKLSIKSSDKEGDTLSMRYPFFVWTNYFLTFILSFSGWLYYIDYANAGSWFLNISHNYSFVTSMFGIGVILIIFICLAVVLLKPRKSTLKVDEDKQPCR